MRPSSVSHTIPKKGANLGADRDSAMVMTKSCEAQADSSLVDKASLERLRMPFQRRALEQGFGEKKGYD